MFYKISISWIQKENIDIFKDFVILYKQKFKEFVFKSIRLGGIVILVWVKLINIGFWIQCVS